MEWASFCREVLQPLWYGIEDILGDETRAGTGIGHEFHFVELLNDGECFVRGHVVAFGRFLLYGCLVMQKRRLDGLRLVFGFRYGEQAYSCAFADGLGCSVGVEAFVGNDAEGNALALGR